MLRKLLIFFGSVVKYIYSLLTNKFNSSEKHANATTSEHYSLMKRFTFNAINCYVTQMQLVETSFCISNNIYLLNEYVM